MSDQQSINAAIHTKINISIALLLKKRSDTQFTEIPEGPQRALKKKARRIFSQGAKPLLELGDLCPEIFEAVKTNNVTIILSSHSDLPCVPR